MLAEHVGVEQTQHGAVAVAEVADGLRAQRPADGVHVADRVDGADMADRVAEVGDTRLGEGQGRGVELGLLVGCVRDRVQEVQVTSLGLTAGGDTAADAAGIPADHVETVQHAARQARAVPQEAVHVAAGAARIDQQVADPQRWVSGREHAGGQLHRGASGIVVVEGHRHGAAQVPPPAVGELQHRRHVRPPAGRLGRRILRLTTAVGAGIVRRAACVGLGRRRGLRRRCRCLRRRLGRRGWLRWGWLGWSRRLRDEVLGLDAGFAAGGFAVSSTAATCHSDERRRHERRNHPHQATTEYDPTLPRHAVATRSSTPARWVARDGGR